jgi:hypothetical protein
MPSIALARDTDRVANTSRVQTLLGARCPAAIVRRVIAVVVAAIERVLRGWPRAHIGEESHEIVTPAVAHPNAAAAVALKSSMAWIVAPAIQIKPGDVFNAGPLAPFARPEPGHDEGLLQGLSANVYMRKVLM